MASPRAGIHAGRLQCEGPATLPIMEDIYAFLFDANNECSFNVYAALSRQNLAGRGVYRCEPQFAVTRDNGGLLVALWLSPRTTALEGPFLRPEQARVNVAWITGQSAHMHMDVFMQLVWNSNRAIGLHRNPAGRYYMVLERHPDWERTWNYALADGPLLEIAMALRRQLDMVRDHYAEWHGIGFETWHCEPHVVWC